MAIGSDGRVWVASAFGESLFTFDRSNDRVETIVGPPVGASYDMVVTKGGDVIWTAVLEGIVRVRQADDRLSTIAALGFGSHLVAEERDAVRNNSFHPYALRLSPA